MCRWIAYRGETRAFEQYVTEPVHSLIAQSLRSLEATARTNGDGFGLGWYGIHPEPGLYRETRPAWSDENLALPLSPSAVSHVLRSCQGGDLYGGDAAELPPVRVRPMDVHAQWLHR